MVCSCINYGTINKIIKSKIDYGISFFFLFNSLPGKNSPVFAMAYIILKSQSQCIEFGTDGGVVQLLERDGETEVNSNE